jgi:hypothetical protein
MSITGDVTMKRQLSFKLIVLAVICILSAYLSYRVYHALQLNWRLEQFMAKQITDIQEKYYDEQWFASKMLPEPSEYFIVRIEAYLIYGNRFIDNKEGYYISRWITSSESEKKVTLVEWEKEVSKYSEGVISWTYSIRLLSGSKVCVMLESHRPNAGSVGGGSKWLVDTSNSIWELEPYEGICEFRDTDLMRTLLIYVQ